MPLTQSLSSFRPTLYLEPMKLESLQSEHSKDSAVFVVRGITIGNTNLYFNATLPSGRVVTSSAKEVQVYSPLRLSPTHIWLVTEAVFKVWSRCICREDTVCVLGVCDYQNMWYHDFANYCLESITINQLIGDLDNSAAN